MRRFWGTLGCRAAVYLLLAVWVGIARPSRAAETAEFIDIIIESRPQGQNYDRYRELEGNWVDSQVPPSVSKSSASGLTPQERCGTRKVLFMSKEGDAKPPPAAARFYPRVRRPTKCFVYITWPTSANASPVYYTVRHAGGEDVVPVVQLGRAKQGLPGNANQWLLLGAYEFEPGDNHWVELRVGLDVDSAEHDYRGQAVSDSIRFTSKALPNGEFKDVNLVDDFQWKSSIDEARKLAADTKKGILICFTLPGSSISQELEYRVFGNDRVRREVARSYIPVQVDVQKNHEIAARLGVYRGGTVVAYSHDGTALGKIREVTDPSEFLERLAAFSKAGR